MTVTRRTAKAATTVSLFFGLWALSVAVTPFFPSAVVPGGVGFGLGWAGRRAGSSGGWRRAATVGIAINAATIVIVLLIALALVT
jgi:hypothetical protein